MERQKVRLAAAPPFALRSVDGRDVALSSLSGKTVVLLFSEEGQALPLEQSQLMIDIASRCGERQGVSILGVHATPGDASPQERERLRVQALLAGHTYPRLLDPHGHVTELYRVGQTPAICIIDPRGTIRYRGSLAGGPNSSSACEQALARALPGQAPITALTQTSGGHIGSPE